MRPNLRAKTVAEYTRHLTRDFDALRGRPAASITRREVTQALEAIEALRGSPTARAARATLSSLYAWALSRSRLPDEATSPVVDAYKPGRARSRDRALSEPEIAAVWRAALADTGQREGFGDIVRLLLLTGCRRDEIGRLRWSEVNWDARLLSFDADRTKNGLPLVVPLSDTALAIPRDRLAATGARAGSDAPVFGRGGRHGSPPRGFSGWSLAHARLERAAGIAPWTLHDLRRTFSTHCNEQRLAEPQVIEVALNHISGRDRLGVAGVYNRALHLPERVRLYDRWARHVAAIVAAHAPTRATPAARADRGTDDGTTPADRVPTRVSPRTRR